MSGDEFVLWQEKREQLTQRTSVAKEPLQTCADVATVVVSAGGVGVAVAAWIGAVLNVDGSVVAADTGEFQGAIRRQPALAHL